MGIFTNYFDTVCIVKLALICDDFNVIVDFQFAWMQNSDSDVLMTHQILTTSNVFLWYGYVMEEMTVIISEMKCFASVSSYFYFYFNHPVVPQLPYKALKTPFSVKYHPWILKTYSIVSTNGVFYSLVIETSTKACQNSMIYLFKND